MRTFLKAKLPSQEQLSGPERETIINGSGGDMWQATIKVNFRSDPKDHPGHVKQDCHAALYKPVGKEIPFQAVAWVHHNAKLVNCEFENYNKLTEDQSWIDVVCYYSSPLPPPPPPTPLFVLRQLRSLRSRCLRSIRRLVGSRKHRQFAHSAAHGRWSQCFCRC